MMGSNPGRRHAVCSRLLFMAGLICLLLAVLPPSQTVRFLISAAVHECGHAVVMRLLGMPVRRIAVRAGGAVLCWDETTVSYWREFVCAAAGPLANTVLAVCLRGADPVGCAFNILLACYNLLPLRGNDGAVMLGAVLALCGCGGSVRRWLAWLGDAVFAVLFMLGAWVFWYGALHDADGVFFGYGALFFCLLVRLIGQIGENDL